MENFISKAAEIAAAAGSKIILAIIVFIIGKIVINKLMKVLKNSKFASKSDATVNNILLNFAKAALYIVLIISIVSILGVPMASLVTVLASAGVAIGMALQGALGNIAGGIMILIFRPFGVGDYVEAAGVEGIVEDISVMYTVLTTLDNKRITVPNGTLMNANVVNYSAKPTRRVDLTFASGKGEDVQKIQDIMIDVMNKNEKVLSEPEAPFAQISGGTNEAMEFTVRAWCNSADYWDVHFELLQSITEALGEAGIKAPAVRVVTDK